MGFLPPPPPPLLHLLLPPLLLRRPQQAAIMAAAPPLPPRFLFLLLLFFFLLLSPSPWAPHQPAAAAAAAAAAAHDSVSCTSPGDRGHAHAHLQDTALPRPPPPTKYDTDAGPVPGKLNVHLVPHTHDDVGWLKTVDQYYVGSNNTIQPAAVQYILDSIITALLADPARRFAYAEQAFFQRWWRVQPPGTQLLVRGLVAAGRLEFINGGWAMHDEACTHYTDMIDQTARGHRFISTVFGAAAAPRVAWQIDPFGHSGVQGYLLAAAAGYDALFFARADYADTQARRASKSMEFVWRGSRTLGATAEVFGGLLAHHYDPPAGFRYETGSPDPPVQDDPELYDWNVGERVEAFVAAARAQAAEFRTAHVMWTMGEDFAYENANTWFKQMDKLVHYVNADGRVNTFYSTPAAYVDAKWAAAEGVVWPVKTGDFFPYASSAHSYWTGYFSSRPGVKGYVRKLSGLLLAARQLEVVVGVGLGARGRNGNGGGAGLAAAAAAVRPTTESLEEALAILQHHDGVSGTEKQHVADDYARRLAVGAAEAQAVVNSALVALLTQQPEGGGAGAGAGAGAAANTLGDSPDEDGSVQTGETESRRSMAAGSSKRKAAAAAAASLTLEPCPLLNLSYCPPSETQLAASEEDGETNSRRQLVVVAYNPLGWSRKEWIRLPVTDQLLEVLDDAGTPVASQLVPVNKHMVTRLRSFYVQAYTGHQPQENDDALFTLVFQASVPPLGYATYFVRPSSRDSPACAKPSTVEQLPLLLQPNNTTNIPGDAAPAAAAAAVTLDSGHLRMTFGQRGGPSSMVHTKSGTTVALQQSFCWYNASVGNAEEGQVSGAYIFRPNSSTCFPVNDGGGKDSSSSTHPSSFVSTTTTIVRGELVEEAHQVFSPWISQVTRLYKGADHAELDFSVGPVPVAADGLGKEVVTRFHTDVASAGRFFTDSNGRDFLRRDRDKRSDWDLKVTEPVAGNYYPLNLGIYLHQAADQAGAADVSVLVDRAVGGASLRDGQLELMLHRRLLRDDGKGVGEPLNETVCVAAGGDGGGEGGAREECHGLAVNGVLLLGVNPVASAGRWRRGLGQRLLAPLQLAFSVLPLDDDEDGEEDGWGVGEKRLLGITAPRWSAVRDGYELPPNVALITLQALPPDDGGGVLVRLAHLYEAGEDAELAQLARVPLRSLFGGLPVQGVTELSLTGNRVKSEMRVLKWRTEEEGVVDEEEEVVRGGEVSEEDLVVELGPMEIRTFKVVFAGEESVEAAQSSSCT